MTVDVVDVSVVAPVFENADTVAELRDRIRGALAASGYTFEIVFVDDASRDDSLAVLRRLERDDPAIIVVPLPRNIGQHRAVLAGLSRSRGARLVVLDADLQDPPEAIPDLLRALDAGADAVFAGRRGAYEPGGRLLTSRLFKTLQHHLAGVPVDAGMFFAMTPRMAQRLASFPFRNPFLVTLIGLSGLPVRSIPVRRDERAGGRSGYSAAARLRAGARAVAQALAWRVALRRTHGARVASSSPGMP